MKRPSRQSGALSQNNYNSATPLGTNLPVQQQISERKQSS